MVWRFLSRTQPSKHPVVSVSFYFQCVHSVDCVGPIRAERMNGNVSSCHTCASSRFCLSLITSVLVPFRVSVTHSAALSSVPIGSVCDGFWPGPKSRVQSRHARMYFESGATSGWAGVAHFPNILPDFEVHLTLFLPTNTSYI